jgi:hypothetical protein
VRPNALVTVSIESLGRCYRLRGRVVATLPDGRVRVQHVGHAGTYNAVDGGEAMKTQRIDWVDAEYYARRIDALRGTDRVTQALRAVYRAKLARALQAVL